MTLFHIIDIFRRKKGILHDQATNQKPRRH